VQVTDSSIDGDDLLNDDSISYFKILSVDGATINDLTVGSLQIKNLAVSERFVSSDSDKEIFTGSDSDTWVDVIEIPSFDVEGDGQGGPSPITLSTQMELRVDSVFDDASPATVNSFGFFPVIESQIVRDLGEPSEEIVWPVSGTEQRATVSSAGYIVLVDSSIGVLMDPGTYSLTLRSRWTTDFYEEGLARFSPSGSSEIDGQGTLWHAWLASGQLMDIRLPSVSSTWFTISTVVSPTKLAILSTHPGSSSFVPYEIRWRPSVSQFDIKATAENVNMSVVEHKR